jgi:serine/threonine protein kinase
MNDQRMIGHYRIVEVLGSGSMGMVLGAVDTFIERPVAIKSLRPELTQDPEFVSRFRSEAKSLALLNHPNITTLYSTMLEGSDLYMVMELVRGRPLDDILRDRGKPLGVKESLAIIAQAADGLSYAHDKGVIHRDIKPCNLMISNDGRVKIMDFGIARVRGSVRLTRVGTAIGTPLYMSPEQCRGAEGDERSDVYSLAIVLYELLAGAPPFSGATEYELIQAQISALPPPLVPRAPGVSPVLESAIMKALAKKPEQRFSSMRAFSDAVGATAMRIDATTVVRNAAHLVEAPQDVAEGKKAQTRTFDLVRSRIATLARQFKALHPALKLLVIAAAGGPLAAYFYFGLAPFKAPRENDFGRMEASSVPSSEQGTKRSATMLGDVDSRSNSHTTTRTDRGPKEKISSQEIESPWEKEGQSAIADDYRLVASNQSQITMIDTSSIEPGSDGHFKAWLISVRAPGHFLTSVAIMKTQHEIDCSGRLQRTISSAFYDSDFEFRDSADTSQSGWSPWIPDTVGETAGKFICGGDRVRTSYPSLGNAPLKNIVKSIYDGPWPAKLNPSVAQGPENAPNTASPSTSVSASGPTPPHVPPVVSSYASPKIEDLRIAIKGAGNDRIKATDFGNVSDAVKVQSLALAKTLADAGVAEAQFVLGMLLLERPDHKDIEGAFNAFSEAAKQGYPDAQANLGVMYQKRGMVKKVDLHEASYWFRQAAEKGDAKAQFWLGCYYQYGWGGVAKDPRKAEEQFSKAIASKYGEAKKALEVIKRTPKGISPCMT